MSQNQRARKNKGGGNGSLTSDRIPQKPAHPTTTTIATASSGKTGPTTHGPPHNKEIAQIDKQIKALRLTSGDTKDPKCGCFCLARDHPLSPHVPICQSCGLILCALNLPQYACPFCATPILAQRERDALISGLEKQVENIREREERERERAKLEAKLAAGAFPTLLDSMKQQQQQQSQQQQQQQQSPYLRPYHQQPSQHTWGDGAAMKRTQDTHKVLSVRTKPGSKKSQVVISSYSSSPAGSRPVSRGPEVELEEEGEKQVQRVPRPDQEPKYAKRAVDPTRPWENLLRSENV